MSEPLEVLHRIADNTPRTLKPVACATVRKFRESERCLFVLACCSFGALGSHTASAACGRLTMDGNTSWGPYRLESGGYCTNGAGLLLTRDAHPVVDEAGGDDCVTHAQVCETPEGAFAVVAGFEWSAVVDLGTGARLPGLHGMAWTFLMFSGGYMIVPYQDSPESSSTKLIRLKPGLPVSVSLEADGPMEISVLNADSAHFEGGTLRFDATIECDAYGWLDYLGELPSDCTEGGRPARLARQTYSLELDKMELRLESVTDEPVRRQRLKKLSEKNESSTNPNGPDISGQPAMAKPVPKIPPLATAEATTEAGQRASEREKLNSTDFLGMPLGIMHVGDVPPTSWRWKKQNRGKCEAYIAITPTTLEALSFDTMVFCDDRLQEVVMKTSGIAAKGAILALLQNMYGPADDRTANTYSWNGSNKRVVLQFYPSTQITTVTAVRVVR